jgi:hypothetical protein
MRNRSIYIKKKHKQRYYIIKIPNIYILNKESFEVIFLNIVNNYHTDIMKTQRMQVNNVERRRREREQ